MARVLGLIQRAVQLVRQSIAGQCALTGGAPVFAPLLSALLPAGLACRERVAADAQERLLEGQQPLLAGEDLGFDVRSLTGVGH